MLMNKDITIFINEVLKPRLWNYIPVILPQMDFVLKNNKWQSRKHYDGTDATHPKDDKSVITQKFPYRVFDNSRQDSKDIITLYMELNNISTVWDAVNRLCNIVGIAAPTSTPEQIKSYQEGEKRRNTLEESLKRQINALFSSEGASTLDYLYNRGWTEKEIRDAELGFISVREAYTIQAQYGVGTDYTLSIPLRSGGRIYGFKFRTIKEQTPHFGKYIFLKGTTKKDHLFNLTGIHQVKEDASIVVVEGELDALHAKVKGVPGIVATSGGGLTEELLQTALNRGIKRVTLLFDKDERGEKFVKDSIYVGWQKRISVLVATFPDEQLSNGTKVHDIDEYLQIHTPEELQDLIGNARRSGEYLLDNLIQKTIDKHGEKNLKDWVERDLTKDVITLANATPDDTERDLILYRYSNIINRAITKEALQAVADEERAMADSLYKKEQTTNASNKVASLLKDGKVDEAIFVMGEVATSLKQIGTKQKYSSLLALPSEEVLSHRMKKKQGELPTLYEFNHPTTNEKERFTLPSGAITFIVAPTSHGKSTFLQNIALQLAKAEGEGIILYFSFEEDRDSVTLQFLNKYIGEDLCRNYNSSHSNNLRAINHYFRTGDDRYIATGKRDTFYTQKVYFMNSLYNSGRLRIFYEDYDSTELIEAIRYICSQTKVRAVFIDYIQLLSKNGNRKQRTEELKDICKELKDLCVETQIPIVVAAQANRETTSPLEMHSQKIAEAADLERIANKILFIWNSSFVAQKSKDNKKDIEDFESRTGINLGSSGKIYARLTKNRGGVVGVEAVLNYNGNTGIIEPNCDPIDTSQSTIPYEDQEYDPF